MNPKTASALRIAAIVSAAAAACFHSLLLALPPLAAIVIYGHLLFRAHRSNPARLAEQAEQPYVLGYSATLSAFVGLLLPIIWTNQLPANVSGVVVALAVALTSTVVGVATMTALKDAADARRGSPDGGQENATIPGPPAVTDPAIEEARRAAIEAHEKRLVEIQARLETFVGDLNGQVQRLTEAVTQLTTLASAGAAGAATFATGVTQLQQVMRDYVDLVRTVVPTVDPPDDSEERFQ